MSDQVLVLGIGNVLWADEGFGVRCIEVLTRDWSFPSHVKLLDGGTQGLYLLPFIEEASKLIVFDAIDYGLDPGTLHVTEGDEVPSFMGAKKMSLHQTGFQEVIAASKLMGYCPNEITLIGCQPEDLEDYGGGLRDIVARQIPKAVEIALNKIKNYGISFKKGCFDSQITTDTSILRDSYENGRPSAIDACRLGDARFFPQIK